MDLFDNSGNGNGGGLDLTTALQVLINTGTEALANRISMGGTDAVVSGAEFIPAAMPIAPLGMGAMGALGRALGSGVAGVAGAAVGVLRSAGGRILGWVTAAGRKVSRKAAVNMAKQFGLVSAAAALGASVEDLAQAVLDEEQSTRRRGRGISAAQIRITNRTIARVERVHRKIAKVARAHVR